MSYPPGMMGTSQGIPGQMPGQMPLSPQMTSQMQPQIQPQMGMQQQSIIPGAKQIGTSTSTLPNPNPTGTIGTQKPNVTITNNNNANNNVNNNANNNANNNNVNDNNLAESNIRAYKNIIIILIIILLLVIIGYFISFSYRQTIGLRSVGAGMNYIFVDTQVNNRVNREKKLCDFYITSAFRPYMVINQRFDYCSLEVLQTVLQSGVRCLYLDIFNNTLNENAYPIVTTGIKKGEWKLGLNSLLFEDVCMLIASMAFSNGYVNNFRDPLILCLNLNTNGNSKCLKKIKNILYKSFKRHLLSNDYTYLAKNMAEVKMKELLDKVVIFSSEGYENSALEELVNYSWSKDEINKISFKSLDPMVPEEDAIKFSIESLKDFNKNNMTIVVPEENSIFTYNYDVQYAQAAGCQMAFINYNKLGPELDSYLTIFRNDSFLPKPLNMISSSNIEIEAMNRVISSEEVPESAQAARLNCPEDGGTDINIPTVAIVNSPS